MERMIIPANVHYSKLKPIAIAIKCKVNTNICVPQCFECGGGGEQAEVDRDGSVYSCRETGQTLSFGLKGLWP